MIIHQHTVDQIKDVLSHSSGDNRLWIHLYGNEGSDANSVIHTLLKHYSSSIPLLFRLDTALFPINTFSRLERLLRRYVAVHPEQFESLLQQFPRRLRQSLQLLVASPDVFENTNKKEASLFLIRLFWLLAGAMTKKGRGFWVLENLSDELSHEVKKLIRHGETLPRSTSIIFLSNGVKPLSLRLKDTIIKNIRLSRLSIRESEQLVKSLLKTSDINARLITNHIHLKSRGNPFTIKILLYAYFRTLLEHTPREVTDSNVLTNVKIPTDELTIFREVLQKLPAEGVGIFALLSRLSRPLPRRWIQRLLKMRNISAAVYREWLDHNLISESVLFGQSFVAIGNHSWKSFVARHTHLNQITDLLPELAGYAFRRPLLYTIELSPLFLEAGEVDLALRLASREAVAFTREGDYHRALNRYAFLRRNLSRATSSVVDEGEILFEMGILQQKLGLFENAFEAFREYRDQLGRRQREKWLLISQKMAQLLFEMDAFSEVRYMLKEIKVKKSVSSDIKAAAAILQGDLEENAGKREYATRNYKTALELLPELRSPEVMGQLYTRLRSYYLADMPVSDSFDTLANKFITHLPADSFHHQMIRLDLIKFYLKQNNFQEALPIARNLYRRSKRPLQPEMMLQLYLLLSEIYGLNGKWYLARGYIERLLREEVLIVNDDWRVKILINAGIIEKELGHFGRALQFTDQALAISMEHGDPTREHLCRIQLGHIYLMVHAMMKSREHLIAAYNWALENHDEEVLFSSACFLSTYELYQQRPAKAAEYLQVAESTLSGNDNLIRYLNLTYYRINYFIQINKLTEAEEIAREWLSRSTGIVKFEYVARWMLGKVRMRKGNTDGAEKILLEALKMVRRCRLFYPEFQILMDLASAAHSAGAKQKAERFSKEAQQAFGAFLTDVEDPILQRQIEESREFDVLLKSG